MPNIRRFMDLNTRHLDAESRDYIENSEENSASHPVAWIGVITPTGYFAYAWEADQMPAMRIPHVLGEIMIHARRHGCDYLMFDCDGPDDPDLTLFDVETTGA